VRSVCLRYFNAAGAAHGIGEWHEPETHLIPIVLQAALGERPHVVINGDDYPTRDGTCIRDYVHVSDLAAAHVQALRVLETGALSHARVNLGTGRGASVKEIVTIAQRVSGQPIKVVTGPRRAGDPAELYADASRARELLGWRAQKSIDDIIADAWQWHSKSRVPAHSAH
jgi:UDP-glucose 4-epimerase